MAPSVACRKIGLSYRLEFDLQLDILETSQFRFDKAGEFLAHFLARLLQQLWVHLFAPYQVQSLALEAKEVILLKVSFV